MEKLKALREQKVKAVADARALIDRAENEHRGLSAEEATQYDKIWEGIVELDKRIEREEKVALQERQLATPLPTAAGGKDPVATDDRAKAEQTEKRAAFNKYLRLGASGLDEKERRALQVDLDTAGGFLVPPQDFVQQLIQFVNDNVWIRGMAEKYTVLQADSLGIATLDADPADPDWTAEIATGGEDLTMKFGKRELRPHPLAKRIKVSNKLVRAAPLSVEAKVLERLAYKFGIAEEKGFITGTGSEQPLGVFTATADGISTGRDVNTGNTTTAFTADGLIEAKYKLKANYHPKAVWIFHRDAIKMAMKLKDGNGQYLWRIGGFNTGLTQGQPPTLLDCPVYLSEYAPNTFTTGKYVGIIGDFSRYVIVDSLSLNFQRLIELYAATNQVGYIGRAEVDGMPALEEAFARVTLS